MCPEAPKGSRRRPARGYAGGLGVSFLRRCARAARAGLVSLQQVTRGHLWPSVRGMDSFAVDLAEARVKRLRQSVLTSARLIEESPPRGYRRVALMITLTYRDGDDWRPHHISEFRKRVREWLKRRGLPTVYVWVAELQQRGALHYHLLLWVPHRVRLPYPDQCGWWPHGDSNVKRAKHACGYMAKYASKGTADGAFPKGARIHGCGGLTEAQARVRRWWLLPSYLRNMNRPEHDIRRAAGGGWLCRELRLIARSPFALVAVGRGSVRLAVAGPPPPALPVLQWVCPLAQREVARLGKSQGLGEWSAFHAASSSSVVNTQQPKLRAA